MKSRTQHDSEVPTAALIIAWSIIIPFAYILITSFASLVQGGGPELSERKVAEINNKNFADFEEMGVFVGDFHSGTGTVNIHARIPDHALVEIIKIAASFEKPFTVKTMQKQ